MKELQRPEVIHLDDDDSYYSQVDTEYLDYKEDFDYDDYPEPDHADEFDPGIPKPGM